MLKDQAKVHIHTNILAYEHLNLAESVWTRRVRKTTRKGFLACGPLGYYDNMQFSH